VGKGVLTGFEVGLYSTVLLAPIGAVVGGTTGALSNKKFVIDGKREAFCDLQPEIMSKLVRK
jgi:hypothetical protein